MNRFAQRGFTLIELMIVVALVAIIATIAFNAFSDSGQDSRRARGMADIQALNDAMARYYQTNFTYSGATRDGLVAANTISLNKEYDYTVTPDPANSGDFQTYRITAVPSSTSSQKDDGAMLMDQTGRRCYYQGNDSPDFSTCPHSF